MDFARAATFPFDDDEWLKKIGIAVLVQFIPIVGQIILQGWSFEISRRVKRGLPEPLAGWEEWGEYLRQGFVIFVANLIYQLPTVIFVCLASFAWFFPLIGAGGDAEEIFAGAGVALIVCFSCIVVIYAILAAVVYFGGYVRYIDNPEFGVFFQFGTNFALVRDNLGEFGMAVIYLILAGLIASALSGITAGIGGFLATPFIMYFLGHILGQLAQRVEPGIAPAV